MATKKRAAKAAPAKAKAPDLLLQSDKPVEAPVIETAAPGSFRLEDALFVTLAGRIVGKGYPHPGEVIVDVALEDGQNHQRFSTYTYDGTIDVGLMGISGPGTWVFHTESPVTQVGAGRDDHAQVIRVGGGHKLVVR